MLPIKSFFIAKEEYLDAISVTSYEFCFKLLYVYELYLVGCRKVWKILSFKLVVFCSKIMNMIFYTHCLLKKS